MLGAQSGIGGGGRYDGLMNQLGGQDLSGIGFGIGIDRVLMACEAEESLQDLLPKLDLFLVPIGEVAKRYAVELLNHLRNSGIRADMSYGDRGLKGGMKAADKSDARYALVIGDDEVNSGAGQLKLMSSGESISSTLTPSAIAKAIGI
jgi:histidyl-tRNA synthetase